MKTILQGLLVGLSMLALAGCGGGDGTSTSAATSTQSTGTIVKVAGSSITVNGRSFDVSRASVRINKAAATPADLRAGMRAHVRAHSKGGGEDEATEVESEAEVRGPVTTVDPANKSFTIGTVKVLTDATTVFDDLTPASFDAIKQDMVVEVDGTRNSAGDILATRVEGRPAAEGGDGANPDDHELHGTVTAIADPSITIGGTKVTVTATTVFLPATTCSLANLKVGQAVEARGLFAADGSLTATRIECEDQNSGQGEDANGENEVEGLVSNLHKDAKTFNVDTQAVRYTDTTTFQDGTLDNLVADARVEVKGTLDGTTLVATEIEFKTARP
jgi:uncharacterized Zn-binding protein involved in type VI secretion